MDSLTQIVLCAAVGEAVLGKKIGNKAVLYGAIAGTIPDLDVIANYLTDTITTTEIHRGFSHSVLFSILMAPILGWLLDKIERKKQLGWKPWAWLFFWCMFTHPLLDAFTTWGTQLLWPFDIRLAFNSVFVIDPLYTIPFLVCVVVMMFNRRGTSNRSRINNLGLLLSTSYLILTLCLKLIVQHKFEAALSANDIEFTEISTRPGPLNTILWNANVDTEDAYYIGDYSFFDKLPIQFKRYSKNRNISEQLAKKPNVQRLIAITKGWYIIEQKNGQWYFNDLRFGLAPKPDGTANFVFSYKLDEKNGKIIATETEKNREDAKFLLEQLWSRVWGN